VIDDAFHKAGFQDQCDFSSLLRMKPELAQVFAAARLFTVQCASAIVGVRLTV
jgi:hypothetical protein